LIEVFTERPALFAQKLSRSSTVTYFCDSTDILHLLDIKKIRNLRFLGDLHGHESTYGLFWNSYRDHRGQNPFDARDWAV